MSFMTLNLLSYNNYCSVGVIELCLLNLLILIDWFLCNSYHSVLFESLSHVIKKVALKKLCCFYKIKNNGIPSYLAELIPSEFHLYNTRNTRNITKYSCRTDAFKYSFFPWTINEWNKLNFSIQASSFNIFRTNLIKIIRSIPNSSIWHF